MAEQREKPGGLVPPGTPPSPRPPWFSGAQIENFRAGWALNIDPSRNVARAHYYRRVAMDQSKSLCGEFAAVRWLYGPGNLPRCTKCAAKAKRL